MIDPPLRILFCTNGGLHGALVLRRLLASPEIRVVGIVCSSRLLRATYGYWHGASEYVRLSGWAYAAYLWCSTSLADSLLRLSPLRPVQTCTRHHGIPLHMTRNINDDEGMGFAKSVSPDLLVSAFFNQRIGSGLAALPRLGAVNIHPAPLPEYRGVDPVFYASLEGSPEVGVTLHRIADEFDAGNILSSETRRPDPRQSVLAATAQLYDRGGEMLLAILGDLARGAAGTPQPPGGRYDSWPTREQVVKLWRQGGALVRFRDLRSMMRGRLRRNESSAS